jgi:hypothetical protein
MKERMEGVSLALHPTLAALFIVLATGADLSDIRRTNPDVRKHSSYNRRAKFPDDISNLLPAHVDRWWEALGKRSSNIISSFSQFSTAAKSKREQEAPKASNAPRIRLLLPKPKVHTAPGDDDMEVDELDGDDEWEVSIFLFFFFLSQFFEPSARISCPTKTTMAAKEATDSRKRKGTQLPDRTAAKRRAGADKEVYVFEVSDVYCSALTGTNQSG